MKAEHMFASIVCLMFCLASGCDFLAPRSAVSFYNRGVAKQGKGDLDGATLDYTRAIELDPKFTSAYYNRGNAKQAKGDLDGAILDYTHAIKLDPKDPETYYNRGNVKQTKGNLDGAILDYTRAIELDPKHPESYFACGVAKQTKGNLDGAIMDFNRAVELDPKFTSAYYNRGNAKRVKGDLDAAIADFRAGADLGHLYSAFFVWIALTEKGDQTGAKVELSDAIERRQKFHPANWETQLGRALLGQVTKEELLALAGADKNDNERHGRFCEAWYYLGMMKLLSGDRDAAAGRFRKSLATDRKDFSEYIEAQRELRKLDGTK